MYILLVLFLEASVVVSSAVPTHICPKGTHLLQVMPGWEVCPPCEDGVTYMADHWHTHLECLPCTRLIDPEVETLVTECAITHDTVIHCRSGFYRRLARVRDQSDQCVKCSECENPTRLCEGFYDTVCCGLPSYEAVLNKDNVYVCKGKPIACMQGQYYSPHNEQCFPCPPDTYMSEDSHNNKECKLCQKVGNNSSRLLLQACNSTYPAIADCKPEYFRHSPQESPLSDDYCSPCQTCQFVGRECTNVHDTVCCDSPEMTVVDNNTGPVCVLLSDTNASSNSKGLTGKPRTSEHIKMCGQNEFINIVNDSFTCQRCRDGTYNDDLNHNRTSCKDCSEFSGRQLPDNCRTGNDVCKNTDSGMSINRIVILVSLIFTVLVVVAYLILKLWKHMNRCKPGRTKYMSWTETSLLYVVIIHMVCSCMLSVFVTNTTVGITIVSILTIILFPVACFLLYKFRNQNIPKNGNCAKDNASMKSTQASMKSTQASMKSTQTSMKSTQASMTSTQASMKSTQASMTSTQASMKSTQASMKSTQASMKSTQASMKSTQASMKSTQASMESTQASMESTQATMESTQASMKSTQASMKSTQASMKSTQASMKSTQASMKSTHASMKSTQASIKSTQASMKSTQATMESTQATMESTQATMESIQATMESIQATMESIQATMESIQATMESTQAGSLNTCCDNIRKA